VAHLSITLRGHAPQRKLWRSERRYVAFIGGLGSGKTFAGACKLLLLPPGARAVVVAPTYPMIRDASQRTFFEICPPALRLDHNASHNTTTLTDDRVIFWRSGEHPDRLRGPNLSHAWIDEAAYCREDLWPVLMGRLRLGRAQQVWLTTTPNGHNWLHREFVLNGAPATHEVINAPTAQNTYLPPGFAQELAARYAADPEFARQELEGAWVDLAGSKRLPGVLLDACYAKEAPAPCPAPLLQYAPLLRLYRAPEPAHGGYVIGADVAEGVPGGDDSAAVVMARRGGAVAAVLAGKLEPKRDLPAALRALSAYYGDAPILVERNNHGHATIGALEADAPALLLRGHDDKPGWLQTASSKAELYNVAARALQDGDVALYDERLRAQLGAIERATLSAPDKGKRAAVDDEAVAFVLANQARLADPGLGWLHRMLR
jgi:phage terminase large subunit-like protein